MYLCDVHDMLPIMVLVAGHPGADGKNECFEVLDTYRDLLLRGKLETQKIYDVDW